MSLATKIFRSSILNLTEHFVQLVVIFFVTPLMVRHLGEVQYGLWLVSMAIIGYYKLLDLGITIAGSRFLAQSIGAGDKKDYQINVSTLLTIYLRIGLTAIPITLVVAMIAPHFFSSEEYADMMRWILLAFGFSISMRFLTRIFPVILRSHVRYDFIVASSLIRILIQGSLVIYFLLKGHGLTTLIVIHICADLIDQCLLFGFARKIDRSIKIYTTQYQRDRAREIIRYGLIVFLTRAGEKLRNGIDPLIIGNVNGLALVPTYSIGVRFLQIFNDIVNAVFGGQLIVALVQTQARHGQQSTRENFLKIIPLSSAFAVMVGSGLAVYVPFFIDRWIGTDFKNSGITSLILVLPYTAMLAQYPAWGLFHSLGRQRYIALLFFGGGAFNLIISLILAYKIGFFGVVWGTFIELSLVYLFILPVLVSRSIGLPVLHYLKALTPGILKAGLPSITWYFLVRDLLEPDYARLFILATGQALIVLGLLWITVLTRQQRGQILMIFQRNH